MGNANPFKVAAYSPAQVSYMSCQTSKIFRLFLVQVQFNYLISIVDLVGSNNLARRIVGPPLKSILVALQAAMQPAVEFIDVVDVATISSSKRLLSQSSTGEVPSQTNCPTLPTLLRLAPSELVHRFAAVGRQIPN